MAAGYVLVSPTNYPVTYYVNPTILGCKRSGQRTQPPRRRWVGLCSDAVWAGSPGGCYVSAAFDGRDPADALWPPSAMAPANECLWAVNRSRYGCFSHHRSDPVHASERRKKTPYMTMVWQVPVAGGPLAIQPPDIQVVEASIMATAS